jgi:hypothetical protein
MQVNHDADWQECGNNGSHAKQEGEQTDPEVRTDNPYTFLRPLDSVRHESPRILIAGRRGQRCRRLASGTVVGCCTKRNYFLRRIPIRPINPLPSSQTAAGTGTASN